MDDIKRYMQQLGEQARQASRAMAKASTNTKNQALRAIASAIRREHSALLQANAADLEAARKNGLEPAMLDRLVLSEKGIQTMAEGWNKSPACQTRLVKCRISSIALLVFRSAKCAYPWA